MARTSQGQASLARAIATLTGLALSGAIGSHLFRQETRQIHELFRIEMNDRVETFQRALAVDLEIIGGLKALFDVFGEVDREHFRVFAEQALERHPAIRALEWVPRITAEDRERIESKARSDGHAGFSITERREGRMVPAERREEYFPVYYAVPLAQNEPALGFDLGSEPVRRAALEAARDRGEMVVTPPLTLVQDTEDLDGFLVFCPVYRGPASTTAERRSRLVGLVVGVYRIGTILEQVTDGDAPFGSGAELKLIDPAAPPGRQTIYARAAPTAIMPYEHEIDLSAGNRWILAAGPNAAFVEGRRTWEPHAAVLIGLLFTLGVVSYLRVIASRAGAVRGLVEERTRDLGQATAHLERQRDILQSVVDNLGDGVVVADEQGKLILFNPAAQQILGQGPVDSGPGEWAEIYGLADPLTEKPIPADELPLARAIAGESCRDAELLVRNPSRRDKLLIQVTATPLRGPSGIQKGGVAVFRDVTERKLSAERLRDSEQRFRTIVEATASALIIVTSEWRIREFNPQAERIFGIGRDEALDRDFFTLCLPPEFREAVAADLGRALAGERTPGFETPVHSRNGAERTLLWSFSRLVEARDRSGVIIATGHDITERRQAEEARRVRELAGHLQSARENERTILAREIHDELGQALTGLKFEISSLKRRSAGGDEETHRRLGEVGSMIDDTIRAVRRLAGALRPQILDELGLAEAIRWQVQEFQQHTGISCELVLEQVEITWEADRATAMFRILQESLTNVARHAEAGRVEIRVSTDGPDVVLEVEDDGTGATDEQLSDGRSFGVLGMRERARMFGGTLKIRGTPGSGTIVTVRMPG